MKPTIYWIDLFAGGGGTTTGIHMANSNAKVVACVNHDATAIASHLRGTQTDQKNRSVMLLFLWLLKN
jgi:site-specific DNA-cytosine methylase